MKKRDFETYHKRFRDFEILTKFSETHVFRGTIRHPYCSPSFSSWMVGRAKTQASVKNVPRLTKNSSTFLEATEAF